MSAVAVTPTRTLWRVGRAPEPWAWPDWEYAGEQRWDDSAEEFRTVYAAESPLACFLEVLAHFRPNPAMIAQLEQINEDPTDAAEFPSLQPGEVPRSWVDARRLTSALAGGTYCDVTAAATIAELRPHFLDLMIEFGLYDFDSAAIKAASPRLFTQTIATWLYRHEARPDQLWDGVAFASRHGDDLRMWAIFERPADRPYSRRLSIQTESEIRSSHPDLEEAFRLFRLRWR